MTTPEPSEPSLDQVLQEIQSQQDCLDTIIDKLDTIITGLQDGLDRIEEIVYELRTSGDD